MSFPTTPISLMLLIVILYPEWTIHTSTAFQVALNERDTSVNTYNHAPSSALSSSASHPLNYLEEGDQDLEDQTREEEANEHHHFMASQESTGHHHSNKAPYPRHMAVGREEEGLRRKRLMGIFRCNGWGPGCTQLDSVSGGSRGGGGGGGGGGGRVGLNTIHYRGGESSHHRSPIERFEPFFTLTSGGSWGPTGKRSSLGIPMHQVPDRQYASNRFRGSEQSRTPRTQTQGDTERGRDRILIKALARLLQEER